MMSSHENARIVKEAYASFEKGDTNAILDLLAIDVEWIVPGPPDILPLAGTYRGRGEVAKFFEKLAAEETYERFEPTDVISEADKVVVFVDYRAAIKSTGCAVEGSLVDVYTVRDGKVQRFCEYYDTAAAVAAYRPASSTASQTH